MIILSFLWFSSVNNHLPNRGGQHPFRAIFEFPFSHFDLVKTKVIASWKKSIIYETLFNEIHWSNMCHIVAYQDSPQKNYRQTLYCRLPISVGVLVVKSSQFQHFLIFCDSFDNSYNFDNDNPRDLWPNSDETYALIECCKQRVSNSLTPETVWSHAG